MNVLIFVTHPGNLSRTRKLMYFSVAYSEVIL